MRTRSTSHSTGLHSNRSTSWNESLQKIPILTPDEILRFEQGKCVITNPAYRSRGEGSIPYLLKIPIAQSEFKHRTKTESLWDSQVQPALQRRVRLADHQALTQALYERIEAADRLLPLPENNSQSASGGGERLRSISERDLPDVLDNLPVRQYRPGLS